MKTKFLLIGLSIFLTLTAGAQWINKLGGVATDAAKRAVERRVDKKATEEADKAMDKMEGKESKKNKEQAEETKDSSDTSKKANNKSEKGDSENTFQFYSKFDFVPGEKVIFFEDFSQDAVGDFPALWNTNGSAEVVTTNLYPGNWMKFVMRESVWTDKLLNLPENYTIEFDVIPLGGLEGDRMSGYKFRLMQLKNVKGWDSGSAPGNGGFMYDIAYFGSTYYSTWLGQGECSDQKLSGNINDEQIKQKMNEKYHVSIWVQKIRIRLYQNEKKVLDLPRAFPTGCVKPDRIRFENGAAMVSNIRVAAGAPDMRNKLITEGKLVSYGIYFDVNKDVVKPESFGTLKEIATILNEVPDVKVKIVGHTDADGNDAVNLDLSKRRAASVKDELSNKFGVSADRLVTDGLGETKPVAPNDSPSNKALNRRVEFIKL